MYSRCGLVVRNKFQCNLNGKWHEVFIYFFCVRVCLQPEQCMLASMHLTVANHSHIVLVKWETNITRMLVPERDSLVIVCFPKSAAITLRDVFWHTVSSDP